MYRALYIVDVPTQFGLKFPFCRVALFRGRETSRVKAAAVALTDCSENAEDTEELS